MKNPAAILGAMGGKSTSEAKRVAVRKNGARGGRPRTRCSVCKARVPTEELNVGPVTLSGWYGARHWQWVNGFLHGTDVRCVEHRSEQYVSQERDAGIADQTARQKEQEERARAEQLASGRL